MLYSIRGVPVIIIVIYIVISIINYNSVPSAVMPTIITAMMVIIVVSINAHSHNGKGREIRWIIPVIIRWIIGNIGR